MSMGRVLVAEDKQSMLDTLVEALSAAGYEVTPASDGEQALTALKAGGFDLVLSDLRMPVMDGMELLRRSRSLRQPPAFIMITAHGSIREAVQAKDLGAVDFIEKPFDLDKLEFIVAEAIGSHAPLGSGAKPLAGVIGSSPMLLEAADFVRRVAESRLPVLFSGESGTGRTLHARALHALSGRSGEFVVHSCRDARDAGLFGEERGGATTPGAAERAIGGTLLLQDVEQLPGPAQFRLARLIEERSFQRDGGSKSVEADVRVCASTATDLASVLKEGRLREDLYYTLTAVSVTLPPLRDRSGDLPSLVEHLLDRANDANGKTADFSPRAMSLIRDYDWPGNVRELAATIERCVVMAAADTIGEAELPADVRSPHRERLGSLSADLASMERDRVEAALKKHNWNQTHAARELRIGRTSLQYKMQKFGLRKPGTA